MSGTVCPSGGGRCCRIGLGCTSLGELGHGLAAAGRQDHVGILRHQAQQGKPRRVHGVVDGHPLPPEQAGADPVDHQMAVLMRPSWLTTRWASRREEGSLTATTMARSASQVAKRNPAPRPAGESMRISSYLSLASANKARKPASAGEILRQGERCGE